MWIKASTQLSEHVYQVVTPVSTHMVAMDGAVVIVDSGITPLAHHIVGQLTPFINSARPFRCVLLTHAEFDHVGGIPKLREAFPDLKVVGSPLCHDILKDPEALRERYDRNAECAAALGVSMEYDFESWASAVKVDHIIAEGDAVGIGDGVDLKVVACPGYSAEGIGFFVRSDEAFAAGEAVGSYHGRERVAPAFKNGLDVFLANIDKISTLNIKVLSLPHTGSLTGDLVSTFLTDIRVAAERFPANVRERIEAGSIREEVLMDILNEWTVEGLSPEGPFVRSQRELLHRMIDLSLV